MYHTIPHEDMATGNTPYRLTPKEEEIMELFWEHGPMFVRELQELYDEPRPHFNTLSTMVRILEDKGLVSHTAFGKSYRYYALIDRQAFSENSLKSVIGKYFGSSVFSAVSTLVKSEEISEEEIRELLQMIQKNKK